MTRARSLLVLTTLAIALLLAACGGGDDDAGGGVNTTSAENTAEPENTKAFTNDTFDLTFRYPDDFELGVATEIDRSTSGEPVARQAIFIDEDNGIILSRYEIDLEVTDDNLDDVHAETDDVVEQLLGHDVRGRRTTIGGLVAFRYDDLDLEVPPNGSSDLAFLFDGRTEYQINCQSTPAHRSRIDDACEQVLDTLERA